MHVVPPLQIAAGGQPNPSVAQRLGVLNLDHHVGPVGKRRAGIDLLGLTSLHASSKHKAGFLMGFAAYAPTEMEIAVKKLANVLRALAR